MKNDGQINLVCDRIEDRNTFCAVLFAISMMRKGTTPNIANARAAKYYRVRISDVAHYTAQHAARVGASKAARRRTFAKEDE